MVTLHANYIMFSEHCTHVLLRAPLPPTPTANRWMHLRSSFRIPDDPAVKSPRISAAVALFSTVCLLTSECLPVLKGLLSTILQLRINVATSIVDITAERSIVCGALSFCFDSSLLFPKYVVCLLALSLNTKLYRRFQTPKLVNVDTIKTWIRLSKLNNNNNIMTRMLTN